MFAADFHIHSRFSRATSKDLDFHTLFEWGVKKGLSLIGSGDCTHPAWLDEIRGNLEYEDNGLFRFRDESRFSGEVAGSARSVRFMLTGEVSTIYKAGGKLRKVHHVICLPDLESAVRFAARLERIGNIRSDGRPILGLDSRDLLETLLEVSPRAVLIPAHIWTPWFSVLGSKSGFDSIEECYRDLSSHIFALETGLSSDPPMNWMVSSLDRYTLVSNSDAHSAQKIAREASLFECPLTYDDVILAMKGGVPAGFRGTLEFFPQEGKYHFDGHRNCGFRCTPEDSRRYKGICPVCGKPMTLGVMYRVVELADRLDGSPKPGAAPYTGILALETILAQVMRASVGGKKVRQEYERLLRTLGPELDILLQVDLNEIRKTGSDLLAQAIRRVRNAEVHAESGFDGEYGTISLFTEQERRELAGQNTLFVMNAPEDDRAGMKKQTRLMPVSSRVERIDTSGEKIMTLNDEQLAAVTHEGGPLMVVAGPGTGKTRTLTERIEWLALERGVDPAAMLAITFSNRAAGEMTQRVEVVLGRRSISARPVVCTFHRLGLNIIQEHHARLGMAEIPRVLTEEEADELFACVTAGVSGAPRRWSLTKLVEAYLGANEKLPRPEIMFEELGDVWGRYALIKRETSVLDFDDLMILPLCLFESVEGVGERYRRQWPYVFVDEYQDVNLLQYRLLSCLVPRAADLFVIGDPDQAIYGFRGADVRYFKRFQDDYPSGAVISLTRNYRSSEVIIRAAAGMLGNHALADKASLASGITGAPRVEIVSLPTEHSEAEHIVKTVESLIGGSSHFAIDSGRGGAGEAGVSFGDVAVLYRSHAVGDVVETAFVRSGIPVQRIRRTSPSDDPLVSEADSYDPRAEGVALMTLHAAKGLEWRVVIIAGVEDGLLPYNEFVASDVDEERRLLFVGMTRAREQLFVTYACSRTCRGQRCQRRPSPFLSAIPDVFKFDNTPRFNGRACKDNGEQLLFFE